MSRDVLTVGSTIRILLLYRGEYSQWVKRFMNYLEEQTDGEAMINTIKNSDQPLPRVTQVSIAGTSLTEQPHLKDKSKLADWRGSLVENLAADATTRRKEDAKVLPEFYYKSDFSEQVTTSPEKPQPRRKSLRQQNNRKSLPTGAIALSKISPLTPPLAGKKTPRSCLNFIINLTCCSDGAVSRSKRPIRRRSC
nr:hypothetical protein [Tanacetum cinerariifolium]